MRIVDSDWKPDSDSAFSQVGSGGKVYVLRIATSLFPPIYTHKGPIKRVSRSAAATTSSAASSQDILTDVLGKCSSSCLANGQSQVSRQPNRRQHSGQKVLKRICETKRNQWLDGIIQFWWDYPYMKWNIAYKWRDFYTNIKFYV